MARVFATPIQLPADPASNNHAANKSYVDTGLAGKAATGHTHTASAVYAAPRTLTTSNTAENVDGTVAGDLQATCSANTVFTPTGTPNGRMLVIEALASGAQRTVSVASGVLLPTTGGPTSRALIVPQNSVGIFGLRYSASRGGWILLAAAVG